MPIRRYLDDHTAFESDAIKARSEALERASTALPVNGHMHNREVLATRVIDLEGNGIFDAKAERAREYRRRAEEAEQIAAIAEDPGAREMLRELALAWRELVNLCEGSRGKQMIAPGRLS
jgi:hypothetical protein